MSEARRTQVAAAAQEEDPEAVAEAEKQRAETQQKQIENALLVRDPQPARAIV